MHWAHLNTRHPSSSQATARRSARVVTSLELRRRAPTGLVHIGSSSWWVERPWNARWRSRRSIGVRSQPRITPRLHPGIHRPADREPRSRLGSATTVAIMRRGSESKVNRSHMKHRSKVRSVHLLQGYRLCPRRLQIQLPIHHTAKTCGMHRSLFHVSHHISEV